MTVLKPQEVTDDITHRSAHLTEFFHQTREVMIHHSIPTGQQAMRMSGLWNAFARFCTVGQKIPFDDRNVTTMIAERPSGEQPAHTGPKHDCRCVSGVRAAHAVHSLNLIQSNQG
jgi:hypothetical protein